VYKGHYCERKEFEKSDTWMRLEIILETNLMWRFDGPTQIPLGKAYVSAGVAADGATYDSTNIWKPNSYK
jgi:hypothetical protein